MRVSNELGAGHPKASLFAVVVVSVCSLIISVVLAVCMLLSRHVISYAFTSGTEVAEAVAELSPFLAGTIVLGGVQPVLSGRLLYFTRAINHGRSQGLAVRTLFI